MVGALPRPGLGGGGHLREKRRRELYDALDQDTQDLLSQAGIGEGSWESGDGGQLFHALSQLLREKLAAP